MKVHKLKTWSEPWHAVQNGNKTFEYRKDDRGFADGDVLELHQWNGGFTGNYLQRVVTYILRGPDFGVPEGYVVMALSRSATDVARHTATIHLFDEVTCKAVCGQAESPLGVTEHHHMTTKTKSVTCKKCLPTEVKP